MSQIINDTQAIQLQPVSQHLANEDEPPPGYSIKFGKVYVVKPNHTEKDGTTFPLFPNEARLRNLTYSAKIMVRARASFRLALLAPHRRVVSRWTLKRRFLRPTASAAATRLRTRKTYARRAWGWVWRQGFPPR